MPKLLFSDGQLSEDPWQFLNDDDIAPNTGDIVVSEARWQQDKDALRQRPARLGIALPNTLDIAQLAADWQDLDLIALNFPSFTDGRAYSQARSLREQYGYGGHIRARGDVLHDQLFYMKRCGFDCFDYPENLRPQDIQRALKTFSGHYQAQFKDSIPLAGVFAES